MLFNKAAPVWVRLFFWFVAFPRAGKNGIIIADFDKNLRRECVRPINSSSVVLIFVVGMLAGPIACQSLGPQVSEQASATSASEKDSREEATDFNQQLLFSKKDLAERLGISAEVIKIKAARKIVWRSGALGCPKPNMSYTQALVPGVLIVLEVEGKIFGYHAQENQMPFFCPSAQAVIPDSVQKDDLA